MSQGVVTDYFAKKRSRRCTQPSKRLKTENETLAVNCTQALKPRTRSKRNVKTNFPVPALLNDKNCDNSEVITAAEDNHNTPETPKQDVVKGKKRGRLSPKKLGFDFTKPNSDESDKMEPQTKFSCRKKLSVSTYHESSKTNSLPAEKCSAKVQLQNGGSDEQVVEHNQVTSTSAGIENEAPNRRMTRSQKSKKVQKSSNSKSLPENIVSDGKTAPELLKDSLKKSKDLKDLQQVLLKVRQQKKKQKKEKESQKKEKGAPPKAAAIKKREFAYEKLHSLAQEIPKELALPQKYKTLAEFFRCTDVVVSMLFNRQQVASWPVMQKSVQEMVRKNFELNHLGQIKFAFPQAYTYRQEKGIVNYSTDKISTSNHQLTVEPNLGDSESDISTDQQRKFTSGMLLKRRHHFLVQLVNIVKEHHKKFLSSLTPPIAVPESKKILRWHPEFPLDSVPDVAVADLPRPPETEKDRCHSAKDILDKARSNLTKKTMNALKNVAEKVSSTPEKEQTPTSKQKSNQQTAQSTTVNHTQAKTMKGISQSLLDKVRAKEADKKLKTMVRSEEDAEKLQKLARLPNVARALRTLFTVEKKYALPLEYVCEKLASSCSGISTSYTVRDHVVLLIKQEPTWLSEAKIRNRSYVKMTQGKDMASILQKLEQKIKEAEHL